MKKIIKKRAGFTLVELLIVIIIIGILAGSMMLVAGSGTDKAEAAKIVSNLRSLRTAALLYHADNTRNAIEVPLPGLASLDKYMDRKLEDITNAYSFKKGTVTWDGQGKKNDDNWYIEYKFPDPLNSKGVIKRLVAMQDAGLYGNLSHRKFEEGSTEVIMKVR